MCVIATIAVLCTIVASCVVAGRHRHRPILQSPTAPSSRLGVYIGYGQSNSDCSCSLGYKVTHADDIFQYYAGRSIGVGTMQRPVNETYLYSEPMLGATMPFGCVYGPLGDMLINRGMHDQVVFATCGLGGSPLSGLAFPETEPFRFLVATYKGLLSKFGHVDGILFHQGESDAYWMNPLGSVTYRDTFIEFLDNMRDHGIAEPTVYVSRATYCLKTVDNTLSNIQANLVDIGDNIKPGPNTDLYIDDKYRRDQCHFTLSGMQVLAQAWYDALSAEKLNLIQDFP